MVQVAPFPFPSATTHTLPVHSARLCASVVTDIVPFPSAAIHILPAHSAHLCVFFVLTDMSLGVQGLVEVHSQIAQ